MNSMKNKVVMITGASKGLGRALTIAFARKGARLAICARTEALIVTDSSKPGDILEFSPELMAVVTNENSDTPLKTILFSQKGFELLNIIYSLGEPVRYEYIDEPWDLDYYQTVFASQPGSVEMPSAGRAFSWELLFKLQQKGIQLDYIQLIPD